MMVDPDWQIEWVHEVQDGGLQHEKLLAALEENEAGLERYINQRFGTHFDATRAC